MPRICTDLHGSSRSFESWRKVRDRESFDCAQAAGEKSGRVGSRNIHRERTGNAERQESGVSGQASVASSQCSVFRMQFEEGRWAECHGLLFS